MFSYGFSQIKYTLPSRFWKRVLIVENGEPMVFYDGHMIRKTVAEKLDQVKSVLPKGVHLKLIDGYRSSEQQKVAWDYKYNAIKKENPSWDEDMIASEVGLLVARPSPITNHNCGGAVDVCLVSEQGHAFSFGTEYAAVDEQGRKKCPMFAQGLNTEQKENRKILRDAMESAGFVWYPGEWWHYCYGDRMWAVYTGRKRCFYGPVTL